MLSDIDIANISKKASGEKDDEKRNQIIANELSKKNLSDKDLEDAANKLKVMNKLTSESRAAKFLNLMEGDENDAKYAVDLIGRNEIDMARAILRDRFSLTAEQIEKILKKEEKDPDKFFKLIKAGQDDWERSGLNEIW